jgi:hypothetical protein
MLSFDANLNFKPPLRHCKDNFMCDRANIHLIFEFYTNLNFKPSLKHCAIVLKLSHQVSLKHKVLTLCLNDFMEDFNELNPHSFTLPLHKVCLNGLFNSFFHLHGWSNHMQLPIY